MEVRAWQLPTERTNLPVVGVKLDWPEWHGFVSHQPSARTTVLTSSLARSAHRQIPATELPRSVVASTRDSNIHQTEPRAQVRMMDAGRFYINRIYE